MKITIDCVACDELYDIVEDDLSSVVCPKCKSEHIFFRNIEWESNENKKI